MHDSPSEQSNYVNIVVVDDPNSSFKIAVKSNDPNLVDTECVLKLNFETFNRLLNAETTFEIEARNNNIEILGNIMLLRNFGKSLRYSN